MTNADKIRTMSNEEMADRLLEIDFVACSTECCIHYNDNDVCSGNMGNMECTKAMLNWLNAEVAK